jgi:DNA-binding NarL/FixJ family response regulator
MSVQGEALEALKKFRQAVDGCAGSRAALFRIDRQEAAGGIPGVDPAMHGNARGDSCQTLAWFERRIIQEAGPLAKMLYDQSHDDLADAVQIICELYESSRNRDNSREEVLDPNNAAWAKPATEAAKPVEPVERKPRARRRVTSKPLTKAQADAMAAYMRCGRNVGAVAAELKISRGAANDRINAALQKTGQKPPLKRAAKSVRAAALPTDNRGQYTVDSDD